MPKIAVDPAYMDYLTTLSRTPKNNEERKAKLKEIANKEKALSDRLRIG